MKDAYDRAKDYIEEYEKWTEDIRDSIIDAYDEIEEKLERQIDKFKRVNDDLERYMDTYTLIYGDESFEAQAALLRQQGQTLVTEMQELKSNYQYWQKKYEEAIEYGDEKIIQEIEDKMDDAREAMMDAAKEAAEDFVKAFEAAVKASTQNILQATIGEKNFDHIDRN